MTFKEQLITLVTGWNYWHPSVSETVDTAPESLVYQATVPSFPHTGSLSSSQPARRRLWCWLERSEVTVLRSAGLMLHDFKFLSCKHPCRAGQVVRLAVFQWRTRHRGFPCSSSNLHTCPSQRRRLWKRVDEIVIKLLYSFLILKSNSLLCTLILPLT